MKIVWINTATTRTLSNTRLFAIPAILNQWGDQNLVLIGGRANPPFPRHFWMLPIPLGRIRLYRLWVAVILPFLCLKHKPDIIITDFLSAGLTRPAVLFRRLGLLSCKFVHDVRTVPVKEDEGKTHRIYCSSLNYACRHFEGITTITDPLRKNICREFGIPLQAIGVWSSGVDAHHFRPRIDADLRRELGLEGQFIVFYHGAVNENRGVIELVEAAGHLKDIPDLRILIVGSGNQWEKLSCIVKQRNLNQVILKSAVPYAQIPRWIALADLCVVPLPDHPWWRVSSPLKLMEYLSMGKPVLLTEMSAHRAIIPESGDAFYVPKADAETFAQGIRRAMAERERFAELGQKGRARAETDLTWEKQAKALRDYLEAVLDGRIQLRDNPRN